MRSEGMFGQFADDRKDGSGGHTFIAGATTTDVLGEKGVGARGEFA
jgi:hypothetical protein